MNDKNHFPPRLVLAATDMSPASWQAMRYARMLAELFQAEVLALHAQHFDLPPYFTDSQVRPLIKELERSRRAAAEHVARQAQSILGFKPKTLIVEKPAVDAILQTARSKDADLVIIGTHGRTGLKRLWLGSVAENVLRHSDRPVLAVRPRSQTPTLKRILSPVGWGDAGLQARDYAVALAQAADAHLILLHALEDGRAQKACPWDKADIARRCEVEEVREKSHPVASILRAAKDMKADLIVMGAQKSRSVVGSMFSSTTEQVMRLAEAPLLLVPKEDEN